MAASAAAKGCIEVPLDKCGTTYLNYCLECGTSGGYDCEKCCPGCTQVVKDDDKYCNCKPGPSPGPPPGNDTWANYQAGGMDVISVTGGDHQPYEKVVIMLHGGGGQGSDWEYQYDQGWLGNLTGLKYVFPTSALQSHVWFNTFKNGCGEDDDCAYDIPSIGAAADRVAELIEHEKALVGGDSSKVYLAGFSEGAQLTGYMQLCKLEYALGGTIVMDGFPLPPLFDMPGHSTAEARRNATYYGQDMRWMIWWGQADPIFPYPFSTDYWQSILSVLGANSTLEILQTTPRMGHTLIKEEFDTMVAFIRGS